MASAMVQQQQPRLIELPESYDLLSPVSGTTLDITSAPIVVSASITLLVMLLMTHLVGHAYRDYKAFIALGPGGTPSTLMGYAKITCLRFFALRNVFAPAPLSKQARSKHGFLVSLPMRALPRPQIQGIVPHRQVNQRGDPATFAKLVDLVENMAAESECLSIGTSCFEKHGTGLFSLSPIMKTCRGEVCHAHAIDSSLHMTLHPADAKLVLEARWGERHPLARGGWFERFVPRDFVLVYSPVTDADLQIIKQIIKAAIWNVAGEIVEDPKRT